jgi:hypothetical protein
MSNQQTGLTITDANGRVQAMVWSVVDQNAATATASTPETNSNDFPVNPYDRAATQLPPFLTQAQIAASLVPALQHQPAGSAPILLNPQTLSHLALAQLMNVAAVPSTIAAQNQFLSTRPPSNLAGPVTASQNPLFYAVQNQLFSPQPPSNFAGPAMGSRSPLFYAAPNQIFSAQPTSPLLANRPIIYATAGMPTNPSAVATTPVASFVAPARTVGLYLAMDEECLSEYQCLLRKQVELFEAMKEDLSASAQGRNKPISLGQVGIRCRHCAKLRMGERAKGSVYFPSKLMSLYQTAQNMANAHLVKDCREVPRDIRDDLMRLREKKKGKSSVGGGRDYWSEGLRVLGVYETEDRRLRFRKSER